VVSSLPNILLDRIIMSSYNACVGASDTIRNYINTVLQDVTEEYIDDYVDIMYDEYLEAMYGADPRYFGPDWD
jgi:hypothetical protein